MTKRSTDHERSKPPSVVIHTHGCKLNAADSQVLASEFIGAGCVVVDDIREADIYVLNTCTVTAQADYKARKALRSVAKINPSILLSATGCYVQRRPEDLLDMTTDAGAPILLGNAKKDVFVKEVLNKYSWFPRGSGSEVRIAVGTRALSRTRAMLKIQEGCDQVCSYCIVPKVRGRETSIPVDELLTQISQLGYEGVSEIVLTGTQLGTYGHEYPSMDLVQLLKTLCDEPTVRRLRVSSLQPHEISEELVALWNNGILCPHFHIPLQSGSDTILTSMRRRYSSRQFLEAVEFVREKIPGASITTDVIVGFPGETDEDFQSTYRLCRKANLNKIHVFPYSIRPGTSAAYLSTHSDPKVIRDRSIQLRQLSTELESNARQGLVGATRSVLWESRQILDGQTIWTGLTDDYVRVNTVSSADLRGSVSLVRFVTGEDVLILEEQIA